MPFKRYGYKRTSKASMYRGTSRRTTAAKKIQSYARARLAAKARKKPVKQVVKNTLAIRKLREYAYGPLQTSISYLDDQVPLKHHPVIFHLNNPQCGQYGPAAYRLEGYSVIKKGHFVDAHLAPGVSQMQASRMPGQDQPNGPMLKFLGAKLQFKIQSFANTRHVDIMVIRQKKIDTNFYAQSDSNNFLPNSVGAFMDLAGPFSLNKVDLRKFNILARRKIYINSKGHTTPEDIAEDNQYTTFPTTPGTKHCTINLRVNKVLKQLHSSVEQTDYKDELALDADPDEAVDTNINIDTQGNYQYDNIHPLNNIFVLYSTDDEQNTISTITGDSVKIACIRTCYWRDKIA